MITKSKSSKTRRLDLTRVWTNPGNLFIDDPRYESNQLEIQIPIGIHYSKNGRIIIHDPGARETVDGYKNKYKNLADFLQEKELAAVVRMDSENRGNHPRKETVYDDLRTVIEYSLKNSEQICGAETPELCLMGFSLGSNAIATVVSRYPQIEKILLMGPGIGNWNPACILKELSKFRGELYIVQGKQDTHLKIGRLFYRAAARASKKEFVIIPNCDHHFRHEVNDKIYSKAPFWAFGCEELLGKCEAFPSPDKGKRLVDKSKPVPKYI